MAWVDFRKVYDMVPDAWMIKALKLTGGAPNVIALLKSIMTDWKTELVSDDTNLGEENINRGIFQGDFLSHLLFIISLIKGSLIPLTLDLRRIKQGYSFQKCRSKLNYLLLMDYLKLYGSNQNEIDSLVRTVEIVTKDIGMKFCIVKCGVSRMKRGREVECDGIELGNGEEIGQIRKGGYKYLDILEKVDICQEDIKENIRKEYYNREQN